MELRHLRLLETVAERGTLSNASKQLNLSQSALSHQLRELEEEMGTVVFHRLNKKLVLTESGKIMLGAARNIRQELERASRALTHHVLGQTGEIRLSTECYTCYHWLPEVLKAFQQAYPNIDISIFPDLTRSAFEVLLEGQTDLALTTYQADSPYIRCRELIRDQQVAILPANHVLAQKSYLLAEDFADVNLFVYRKPTDTQFLFSRLLTPAGIMPKKTTLIQLTDVTVDMVRAGHGIAVMATWAARPYLSQQQDLVAVPITKHGLARTWYVASLKEAAWPPHYDYFLKHLQLSMRGT